MTENLPKTFYFSKKKYIWLLFASALFVILASLILLGYFGEADLVMTLACCVGIIFFGIGVIISLYVICTKPIKVLEIKEEGLYLFPRPIFKPKYDFLFLPWKEILSIQLRTIVIPVPSYKIKQTYIFIDVTCQEILLEQQTSQTAKKALTKKFYTSNSFMHIPNCLMLDETNLLTVSYTQLLNTLCSALKKAHTQNPV